MQEAGPESIDWERPEMMEIEKVVEDREEYKHEN